MSAPWPSRIAAGLLLVAAVAAGAPPRVVFVVPVEATPTWHDDLFLVATAAASRLDAREPLVCAVDAAAPWRPELVDYLRRLEPGRVIWLGPGAPEAGPAGVAFEVVPADSVAAAARAMARQCWTSVSRAVTYDPADRAGALAAAVLAARMRVPLLPVDDAELDGTLRALGVSRLLAVGIAPRVDRHDLRVTTLAGPLEVARHLATQPGGVDYLAVVHPRDGGAVDAPRLAFAGVLLAAGRHGAIVPLPGDTVWKRRQGAPDRVDAVPAGVHPSRAGHRAGSLETAAGPRAFVTGIGDADGRAFVQVDVDGDGGFGGEGEAPVRTGGVVTVGGTAYVVDLDVDEKDRGGALWLTSPTPQQVRQLLDAYRDAVRAHPRHLCLVGWPDAVPLAVIGDGQGVDADVVSDHAYAQEDADPFVDVAFARFLAADAPSATLQACRGFTCGTLRDRAWAGRFATAEWASSAREPLERAGQAFAGHHDGAAPITPGSPLCEVGAIVHGSHAMWTVLGGTYAWDSDVLLAPCLVESSGCSTASIDQDQERRSVAARMLRNGAIAFVGNARRGVAQAELYRTELWNALLRGATLGEAHRDALNRVLVAVLEKGELERGMLRYQFDHVAAYGDPALRFPFAPPPAARTTRVEVRDLRAAVIAPRELSRIEYVPLAEWGCASPRLYTWRAVGMGAESWWHAGDKRNEDDLIVTAAVRTRRRVTRVEPLRANEERLGWTGSSYVDEHADGTRSIYWRCRMVDFDMTTGRVRGALRRFEFRLRTD